MVIEAFFYLCSLRPPNGFVLFALVFIYLFFCSVDSS
jgi:hypothetical protein